MFVNNSTITGFIWPREAIEYAKLNPVALAFLDIELGKGRGFDPVDNDEPHIALENIRQRLEIMCGGWLAIEPNEGGTVVTVTIPDGSGSAPSRKENVK